MERCSSIVNSVKGIWLSVGNARRFQRTRPLRAAGIDRLTSPGKGDHRHIRGKETLYRFVSLSKLRRDFDSDMKKYGGDDEKDAGIGR